MANCLLRISMKFESLLAVAMGDQPKAPKPVAGDGPAYGSRPGDAKREGWCKKRVRRMFCAERPSWCTHSPLALVMAAE